MRLWRSSENSRPCLQGHLGCFEDLRHVTGGLGKGTGAIWLSDLAWAVQGSHLLTFHNPRLRGVSVCVSPSGEPYRKVLAVPGRLWPERADLLASGEGRLSSMTCFKASAPLYLLSLMVREKNCVNFSPSRSLFLLLLGLLLEPAAAGLSLWLPLPPSISPHPLAFCSVSTTVSLLAQAPVVARQHAALWPAAVVMSPLPLTQVWLVMSNSSSGSA